MKKVSAILLSICILVTTIGASAPIVSAMSGQKTPSNQGVSFVDFDFGEYDSTTGIYHDGTENVMRFSGDLSKISVADGQLHFDNITASTTGAFGWGFSGIPTQKFGDFEVSYDLIIHQTTQGKHLGFQFGKNGWSDGWSSKYKFLLTFDKKMNFFDGETSVANVDGSKYNRLPSDTDQSTFRVRHVVENNMAYTYINESTDPIIAVDYNEKGLQPGFLGFFGNGGVDFSVDNLLFLDKAVMKQKSLPLFSSSNQVSLLLPKLAEPYQNIRIAYTNTDDGTPTQVLDFDSVSEGQLSFSLPERGKSYSLLVTPFYRSEATAVVTTIPFFLPLNVVAGETTAVALHAPDSQVFTTAVFPVELRTMGAEKIIYTLDGSSPSEQNGTVVMADHTGVASKTLRISEKTQLQAIALRGEELLDSISRDYAPIPSEITVTPSGVFSESHQVNFSSETATGFIFTTDGTTPLFENGAAVNGTHVLGSSGSLAIEETTTFRCAPIRQTMGEIVTMIYTRQEETDQLVTAWGFSSEQRLECREQDDVFGTAESPWTNLLDWDVNPHTGNMATHIAVDDVFRDDEGVHVFTSDLPVTTSNSNPSFYLDLNARGLESIPSDYRYIQLVLKVNHTANAAVYFGTDEHADSNRLSESRKVSFRNTAKEEPEFQTLLIDMGESANWKGNITKLRIDPMATYPLMKDDIEIVMKSIRLLRPNDLKPELRIIEQNLPNQEIFQVGDHFVYSAVIKNIGAPTGDLGVVLHVPDFITAEQIGSPALSLGTGKTTQVKYNMTVTGHGAGGISLSAGAKDSSGKYIFTEDELLSPVRMSNKIYSLYDILDETESHVITSGQKRLVFPKLAEADFDGTYGFGWLEMKGQNSWEKLAILPSLGSVQYVDLTGGLITKEIYASEVDDNRFSAEFVDTDGVAWRFQLEITVDQDGDFRFIHEYTCDEKKYIGAISGPTLLLGEQSVQSVSQQTGRIPATETAGFVTEALFPGLEWLDTMEGNNRSSDETVLNETQDAYRYVPHPNKITIPLMSMRKGNAAFGIMWEMNQTYDGEHTLPSAFFGLPNRLEHGEETQSSKMSLFIPSVPGELNENATTAQNIPSFCPEIPGNDDGVGITHELYEVKAGQKVTLESTVFISEQDEIAPVVKGWIAKFGLPQPLDYAHGTMAEESNAILQSFENLWSEKDQKWNNRIGPPATPMITSAFLLPYATLKKHATQEYQTVAEKRLETAIDAIGNNYAMYGYVVPFFLDNTSFTIDDVLLASKAKNVDVYLSAATNVNGVDDSEGFYWDYETFIANKNFEFSPHIGQRDDVTSGSNAEFLYKILRYSRLAGDVTTATKGLTGLDYINENYTFPRGSQSWELMNQLPEVGAAVFMIRANVDAFLLTREESYLKYADDWALRGLPFVYLWDDASYGIDKDNGMGGSFGSHTFMRYASCASFGQSIYRSSGKALPTTWFGKPVQWLGHDLGIALMELHYAMEDTGYLPSHLSKGGINYQMVAEGLSVSGSRQTTAADAKYPNHLYDAVGLLQYETSDYLYANYQGAELLALLLGERTNQPER